MTSRAFWILILAAIGFLVVCGIELVVGYVPPSGPVLGWQERLFYLCFGIAAGLVFAAALGLVLASGSSDAPVSGFGGSQEAGT